MYLKTIIDKKAFSILSLAFLLLFQAPETKAVIIDTGRVCGGGFGASEMECVKPDNALDAYFLSNCVAHFECCLACGAGISTCTLARGVPDPVDYFIDSYPTLASCRQPVTPTPVYACSTNNCTNPPNPNDFNGESCTVRQRDDSGGAGVSSKIWESTGKWDALESKCIKCSGQTEGVANSLCGNNAGIYIDSTSACTIDGDGQCESACGADPACDEVLPNTGLCGGATGCQIAVCNNNTICEAGLGETTANCPNDCCNKACGGGCTNAVDCAAIEPDCVGVCVDPTCVTDSDCSECDPNAWFFCNPLRGSVETIVQAGEQLLGYILGLIGSIALLFVIIAGIMYMTSAGNEERIASSKRILTGAVIGLTIALLAYGLLHVIMTVLGM